VKKTRADWTGATKYSALCSEHFEKHCFEEGPLRRAELGIPTKRPFVLKKDAIPTIFNRPGTSTGSTTEQKSTSTGGQTGRSAYTKRERKRVRTGTGIIELV
jgi:hypothetical protein